MRLGPVMKSTKGVIGEISTNKFCDKSGGIRKSSGGIGARVYKGNHSGNKKY